MTWPATAEIATLLRHAEREPLVPLDERHRAPGLDRTAIEAVLPHRDPFLLLDRVTAIDPERGRIAAYYDLARAAAVFAGHFPSRPIWPGVLQVEAIAQAGGLLYLQRARAGTPADIALTRIVGARFMRPITPGGEVEILARGLEDGLFFTVVGQCFQGGNICSVAAVIAL